MVQWDFDNIGLNVLKSCLIFTKFGMSSRQTYIHTYIHTSRRNFI